MRAKIIDGKAIAHEMQARLATLHAELHTNSGSKAGLAVILAGDDPASQVYVRNKHIATTKAGLQSFLHHLPTDTTQETVINLVRQLNADNTVDGILVQMPLPSHISAHSVINEIDPEKDVDGLTQINAGKLLLGEEGLVPCTPQGAMILIKTIWPDLAGKQAVILGRSILVGKPLAMLLTAANATVTLAHSHTRNLAYICQQADILCAATGRPHLVPGSWVKPGAVVIDIGINRVRAPEKGNDAFKLVGDVATQDAKMSAKAITPVPGGVGPMTIACLLRNTIIAAYRRRKLDMPEGIHL